MAKARHKKGSPVVADPLDAEQAPLSPLVKFSQGVIQRKQIQKLPYNPRHIDPENRRRLLQNLKQKGLLEALTWNKRTGNLVSGHQRISIIDSVMGTADYTLPVNIVDLSEKEEKEQAVFFNNAEAQGEWDLAKLGQLFTGPDKLEAEAAGFSPAAIYQWFGDAALSEQPEQLELLAAQMREARERYNKIKEMCGKRDDDGYYLVVFASADDRRAFLDLIGLPDNRYVNGSELKTRVISLDGWTFTATKNSRPRAELTIAYTFRSESELAAFRDDAKLPAGTRVVSVERLDAEPSE